MSSPGTEKSLHDERFLLRRPATLGVLRHTLHERDSEHEDNEPEKHHGPQETLYRVHDRAEHPAKCAEDVEGLDHSQGAHQTGEAQEANVHEVHTSITSIHYLEQGERHVPTKFNAQPVEQ